MVLQPLQHELKPFTVFEGHYKEETYNGKWDLNYYILVTAKELCSRAECKPSASSERREEETKEEKEEQKPRAVEESFEWDFSPLRKGRLLRLTWAFCHPSLKRPIDEKHREENQRLLLPLSPAAQSLKIRDKEASALAVAKLNNKYEAKRLSIEAFWAEVRPDGRQLKREYILKLRKPKVLTKKVRFKEKDLY